MPIKSVDNVFLIKVIRKRNWENPTQEEFAAHQNVFAGFMDECERQPKKWIERRGSSVAPFLGVKVFLSPQNLAVVRNKE